MGALSGAIGSLHLGSSPDDSGAAPGSIPAEALVPGTGGWQCVCYGIGNFATCAIARSQLAFLLLFLEKCQVHFGLLLPALSRSCPRRAHRHLVAITHSLLQIPRSHCWVYDPLFSQLEIAVLTTLGVTVLGENEVSGLGKGSVALGELLTRGAQALTRRCDLFFETAAPPLFLSRCLCV